MTSTVSAPAAYVARWRLTPRTGISVLRAEVGKGLTTTTGPPCRPRHDADLHGDGVPRHAVTSRPGTIQHDLLPPALVGISGYWMLQFASMVMVADLVEGSGPAPSPRPG